VKTGRVLLVVPVLSYDVIPRWASAREGSYVRVHILTPKLRIAFAFAADHFPAISLNARARATFITD